MFERKDNVGFIPQENYVEYSRTGQIIKGAERKIIRSKYEEDVFVNNHTTVWGSYWENFRWGYKCCHSFVKNSYCTGSTGKLVRETNVIIPRTDVDSDSQPSQEAAEVEVPEAAASREDDQVSVTKSETKESKDDSSEESDDSDSDVDSEEERRRKKKQKEK